jgi:2-dehydro-3-deoxyphosphogalactonate aldolase
MSKAATWLERARQLPLVAILRGLNPLQATGIGQALVHSGFRLLEVPLNRPGALQCIEALRADLPAEALVGGGTVLTVSDVNAVHAAGGQMVVSPNTDVRVISRAAELGMLCAPGVATPTEAFTALQAGAHALKVFPSDMVGHGGLKALRSVLPAQTELWPVGGISPGSIAGWVRAGATGFGIGSQLYVPGDDAQSVRRKATAYREAWEQRLVPPGPGGGSEP